MKSAGYPVCLTTTSMSDDSIPASLGMGVLGTSTGAGVAAGVASTGVAAGGLTATSPPFIRTM